MAGKRYSTSKLHEKEEKLHKKAESAMKADEKLHKRLAKAHKHEESEEKEERLEEKVSPGIHKKIKKLAHKKKKKKDPKPKGKVEKVLHEFKEGSLHSGSKKGPQVKSRKQAIAIALSEARKAGEKVKPMKRKKK